MMRRLLALLLCFAMTASSSIPASFALVDNPSPFTEETPLEKETPESDDEDDTSLDSLVNILGYVDGDSVLDSDTSVIEDQPVEPQPTERLRISPASEPTVLEGLAGNPVVEEPEPNEDEPNDDLGLDNGTNGLEFQSVEPQTTEGLRNSPAAEPTVLEGLVDNPVVEEPEPDEDEPDEGLGLDNDTNDLEDQPDEPQSTEGLQNKPAVEPTVSEGLDDNPEAEPEEESEDENKVGEEIDDPDDGLGLDNEIKGVEKQPVKPQSTEGLQNNPAAVPALPEGLEENPEAKLEEELEDEDKLSEEEKLFEQIMNSSTSEELEKLLAGLTEAQVIKLSQWVDEKGKNEELEAKVESLFSNSTIPPALHFSDAGPLMPAVNYGRAPKRSVLNSTNSDNGVELFKSASLNSDGSYKIRLEAYVTGETTIETTMDPVDIVLVLDQSGSMAWDFNGNTTNDNTKRRQYALKQSVNKFIDNVANFYSDTADHRISIVTYDDRSTIKSNWRFVDPAGKSDLKSIITNLPSSPSGGTNTGAGMTTANTLITGNAGYTGNNTNRHKVVIVFTDGVPTELAGFFPLYYNIFSTAIANTAVSQAKSMKDSDVTVYSIGIFNGANSGQLFGAGSNGNVGSYWSGTIGGAAEAAAANRFMNYISNNFMDATSLGLSRDTSRSNDTFRITANFARDSSSYYLTTNTADGLEDIFEELSQTIGGATNTVLTSESTIQDTVTPYFDVPTEADAVKFYTADCTGASGSTLTFGPDEVIDSPVIGSFNGQKLTVTGFDFKENWCGHDADSSSYRGKKLIVEFDVIPKDGFLGGNGVPTNEGLTDGIYDPEGNIVEGFEVPTVDVPLKPISIDIPDELLGSYYGQFIDEKDLKLNATVTIGTSTLDFDKNNYGLEPWQNAFVVIDVSSSTNPQVDFNEATVDFNYTLSVTVRPINTGTIDIQGSTGTGAGKILIFKPNLTFEDSDVWYGGTASYGDSPNLKEKTWTNNDGKTVAAMGSVFTMLNDEPDLNLEYTPSPGKIVDGIVSTKEDIEVDVDVSMRFGNDTTLKNINNRVTFNHEECSNSNCSWTPPSVPGRPAFLLHVKTGQLTVSKAGGNTKEPYVFEVYKDGIKYTEATITGNGSVTIYELPLGTYSIKEDTGWSWRFSPTYSANVVVISSSDSSKSIGCTNQPNVNTNWLNGYSEVRRNTSGIIE